MRLNEISTAVQNKEVQKYDYFFNDVKHECQPFLTQAKNQWKSAYRALANTVHAQLLTKTVRLDNRTPLSSTPSTHKLLNDYFTNKFGAPFRNALFITGSREVSSEYGQLYRIFPIGPISYIWSPHVDDLYDKILSHGLKVTSDDPKLHKELINVLDHAEYINTDLDAALAGGNEVMIRCSSYHAISNWFFINNSPVNPRRSTISWLTNG